MGRSFLGLDPALGVLSRRDNDYKGCPVSLTFSRGGGIFYCCVSSLLGVSEETERGDSERGLLSIVELERNGPRMDISDHRVKEEIRGSLIPSERHDTFPHLFRSKSGGGEKGKGKPFQNTPLERRPRIISP